MMIRLRGVGVIPQVHSKISVIGGKVHVSKSFIPEVDFTYFFTQNISAELIVATTKHKMTARRTIVGNKYAGHVWLLPPTLTLQYRVTQCDWVKPYIGTGPNWTIFYNSKPGELTTIKYKRHRFGWAVQFGLDFPIKNGWYFNLDAKKLFLRNTARATLGAVKFGAKVRLDPWLLGFGVGYRF